MKHLTRTCPSCGQAVTGRADKIYCSAGCRKAAFLAQHAADEAADQDPDEADAADWAAEADPTPEAPGAVWQAVPLRDAPLRAAEGEEAPRDPVAQVLAQLARERAAQDQAAATQARRQRYHRLVAEVLDEPRWTLRQTWAYQQQVRQLLADYLAQPAGSPAAPPACVACLHRLGDELRALVTAMEAARQSLFGASPRAREPLVLGQKFRQRLRASLPAA